MKTPSEFLAQLLDEAGPKAPAIESEYIVDFLRELGDAFPDYEDVGHVVAMIAAVRREHHIFPSHVFNGSNTEMLPENIQAFLPVLGENQHVLLDAVTGYTAGEMIEFFPRHVFSGGYFPRPIPIIPAAVNTSPWAMAQNAIDEIAKMYTKLIGTGMPAEIAAQFIAQNHPSQNAQIPSRANGNGFTSSQIAPNFGATVFGGMPVRV